MNVKPCECPMAGYCARHRRYKDNRLHGFCKKFSKWRLKWDRAVKLMSGVGGQHRFRRAPNIPRPLPGTELKAILAEYGFRPKASCPCNSRAAQMDKKGVDWCEKNIDSIATWLQESAKEISVVHGILANVSAKKLVRKAIDRAVEKYEKTRTIPRVALPGVTRRNLIYHIYPALKNPDIWRWNLDELIKRIDLFNGRRVIGVTYDASSEHPDAVKEYLSGHDCEFIVLPNIKKLGENVTAIPLMEAVQSFEHEVTFRAHAKGVSKKYDGKAPKYRTTRSGTLTESGWAVKKWTEIMYAVCLDDWQTVQAALESHAMAGPYRRFTPLGKASWFFSGSFYWYEHSRFYARDWKRLEPRRYGVESLPGLIFTPAEVACIYGDNTASLYHHNYMQNTAWPDFEKWRASTVPNRVLAPGRNVHPSWFINSRDDLARLAETTSSDINEHCYTLRRLAEQCGHVTEFGVRYGVSTVSLLSGQPGVLRSYDINTPPNLDAIKTGVGNTDFQFTVADTRKVDIEPTDFLFIDTEHTYAQLKVELGRHAGKVRRYIAMHDTEIFGAKLRPAINEFLADRAEWSVMADFTNNNGLMVLRREN